MDEHIIKKLDALLTQKLHIDSRKNPIHIKVEGDALVIEGTVERVAHKKRALLLAMTMEGVGGVVDRLMVRPASAMGDREIRAHIMDAVTQEPTLDPSAVTVEVAGGKVDIEGRVGSLTHKRLCGVLAWWVPGTREVINSLEVHPPEEDNPDEITDAVRTALEKDRLVDAASIGVSTSGWVVTLSGVVRGEAERDAAEDDAWYVWGVNDVINNIKVAARA